MATLDTENYGGDIGAGGDFQTISTDIDNFAPTIGTRFETAGTDDYTDYRMQNEFTQEEGLIVLPVAARVAAHRIIRLHGGYGMRKVNWTASRMGKPPMIPTGEDTAEDTFLSSTVAPSLPRPNKTGGYDWTVSGSYTYVQKGPRYPGWSSFPVGNYPFPVEPAASLGSAIIAPMLSAYTGELPFQSLFSTVEDQVSGPSGIINWPFLALPAAMSSTHLIGG